jgi:prephenate dehydrogenase
MEDEPGFFEDTTVAVIGLGLMGGSLVQALKGKCRHLIGVDSNRAALEKALNDKSIDAGYTRIELLPDNLDGLILAVPIHIILEILNTLPNTYPNRVIVMDFGSTKAKIVHAMSLLPDRFDPLGGHPMCGKEVSGYDQADGHIFQGAAFAITPLERTSATAIRFANKLVEAVGAVAIWTDPESHDRQVAYTSHLPYLVANALAAITPLKAAKLAGPGFESTTRLAPESLEMMLDIMRTNRSQIIKSIQLLQQRLSSTAAFLEMEEYEKWFEYMKEGKKQHAAIRKAKSGLEIR